MNRNRSIVWLALLVWLAAMPAAAERALPALSDLVSDSQSIVIGQVSKVESPGTASEVATLDVLSTIRGVARESIQVRGLPVHEEGHAFQVGQRLALFLESRPDGRFELVDGGAGVFGVDGFDVVSSTELLLSWASESIQDRFTTLLGFVPADGQKAPAALLAAATEDFVSSAPWIPDATVLAEISCGTRPAASRAMQYWALRMAGELQIAAARPCLEALFPAHLDAEASSDRELTLAVMDGLVSFGGDSSVHRLEGWLAGSVRAVVDRCDPSIASAVLGGLGRLGHDGDRVDSMLVARTAFEIPYRTVASSAVHALGLIRGPEARSYLDRIARQHPDALIREQAQIALARY